MSTLARWPNCEPKLTQAREDIVILQRFHIAGRDMNDSVSRFLSCYDALGKDHAVVVSRVEQMRRDLPKWQETIDAAVVAAKERQS